MSFADVLAILKTIDLRAKPPMALLVVVFIGIPVFYFFFKWIEEIKNERHRSKEG